MVQRILFYEEQCRRFRQAVGAEGLTWINRLFRGVEQQAPAGALRPHDADRVLRHCVMREKIQFERFSERFLIYVADAPLPCSAGI